MQPEGQMEFPFPIPVEQTTGGKKAKPVGKDLSGRLRRTRDSPDTPSICFLLLLCARGSGWRVGKADSVYAVFRL